MGGNVTAITKFGHTTRAEKIPLEKIGRSEFMVKIKSFLKSFNQQFKKFSGKKLWENEDLIASGFIFNGSTSFIMDPTLSDAEVVKVKKTAGDLDITVPETLKTDLFNFLDTIEEKEVYPGITYMGSNKRTLQSVGEQINSLWVVRFSDSIVAKCQIDFEFLPYENNKPTEWAKFSHSSSFDDAKNGVKSVMHKYILRALIGGASIRDDIVIATGKSTPDKITISKNKNNALPRMLKFSVGRGIRVAYHPMLDANGKQVYYNGKQVYLETPTSQSNFINIVSEIYKLAFGRLEGNEADLKEFQSFVGILKLMKKYLNKVQIQRTYERFVELLWGVKPQRGQELEVGNPELDKQVKMAGYTKFIKFFGMRDESEKFCKAYYKDYGQRQSKVFESFIDGFNEYEVAEFCNCILETLEEVE